MKIKLDPASLIVHLAYLFDNHEVFNSIRDNDGNFIVSIEDWPNFCHDIGIILATVMQKVSKAHNEEE